jgi:hypothetical protein
MDLELPVRVLEAYAVSNTPAFLYKALKADPYVVALRSEYTLEELEENLAARDAADKSAQAVVGAYCQLIAAIGMTSNIAKQVRIAAASRLQWAERIVSLHRGNSAVSNSNVQSFGITVTNGNVVNFELSK